MAGVPLPLSLNDIELYLASRTILIDRIEFDAAIQPSMMPGELSGLKSRKDRQEVK